jgi:hypothetical protein
MLGWAKFCPPNFANSAECRTRFYCSDSSLYLLILTLYLNILRGLPDAADHSILGRKMHHWWQEFSCSLGYFSALAENIANITPFIADGIEN